MKPRLLIFSLPILLMSGHSLAAAPTCSEFATNPAYGLAGNLKITSATASITQASGNNKAFCNVQLTYSARSGPNDGYDNNQSQAIKVGIGLPLNTRDGGTGGVQGAWNGKLQNLGGGVCAGSVGPTTSATNAGYVGSSTDGGHTTAENGQGCDWGVIQSKHILNTGKINDFFYASLAFQVIFTRKMARHYYSRAENYTYWNGCSTGGRQGLSLAQRFSDLGIDGYIMGAPAIYWQAFRLADDWPLIVIRDKLATKGKALTPGQINAVNAAAVAACDVQGFDKVADGITMIPGDACLAPNTRSAVNRARRRSRIASMPIRRRRLIRFGTGHATGSANGSGSRTTVASINGSSLQRCGAARR